MTDNVSLSLVRLVRGLMLRTGNGPLRFVWRAGYWVLIQTVCAILRFRSPDTSIYCRGSVASGRVVYGLSDLDLVVVPPDSENQTAAGRLRGQIRKVYNWQPLLKAVVEVSVLGRSEIMRAVREPFQNWPIGARALRYNSDIYPEGGARLYGPLKRWRRLKGPDPLGGHQDGFTESRWVWVWLDLQFMWRHMFRLCVDPEKPHAAYFCTKNVLEIAGLWLWLTGRVICQSNEEIVERCADSLPSEVDVLREMLILLRKLSRKPRAPVAETVANLYRMSVRIEDLIEEALAGRESVQVRLLGSNSDLPVSGAELDRVRPLLEPGREPAPMPLIDWAALVVPKRPDEAFVLVEGNPAQPADLSKVARVDYKSPYATIAAGKVSLMPTAASRSSCGLHGSFRSLQCPVSDPVPFAVAGGRSVCRFSGIPGWSARTWADRAVAELGLRLRSEEWAGLCAENQLGLIFGAARAAVLQASLDEGDAELPLTAVAAINAIRERHPQITSMLQDAHGKYVNDLRAAREAGAIGMPALRTAILELPCYRRQG